MKQPPFQLGLLVQDIEAARAELEQALGITWGPLSEVTMGQWPIRMCFSTEGPPFLELIEGPAGSPWDSTTGSRLDHIGFWVNDLDRAIEAGEQNGLTISQDGRPDGWPEAYLQTRASGLRIEYLDAGLAPQLYGSIGRTDQLPAKPSDTN
jgi:hypothetical protein